ncbi:MAG: HlyD family efflux transporter periplasmic adaptor subunit [Sedimentisphaerales bacterium]
MSLGSILSRCRLHLLPVLVWLGALACVVALFSRRSQRFEVLGMAQGQIHQVAATCPARLSNVSVQLFDTVAKGQTVAVVNTVLEDEQPKALLRAQLDTASAEIEHLAAQLVPTQETLSAEEVDRQTARISDARRFEADVENARLDKLRLTTLIETDKMRLEDLGLDVKINEELVAKQAIAPYELQKVKAQHNALAKKIEENKHLLDQTEAALQKAQQRKNEYAQVRPHNPSVDGALDVIRKGIVVQEKRMNELLARIESLDSREALELKAPSGGIVSQVLHRPSEVVLAGEPILTVAEPNVTRIIGYATENLMNQIHEGMAVELVRTSEPTKIQIERSEVVYVGPAVEQMPEQLWQNPNVPQWGRPFGVKVPTQMKLVVGERVGIRRL